MLLLFACIVMLCAAVAYVVVALIALHAQRGIIYQPRSTRPDGQTPCDRSIGFRAEYIRTSDGNRLHAWWVPGFHPDAPVALVCHGNSGNISQRSSCVEQFVTLGCAVLLFDYRGFGNSSGKPNERGLFLDALAAWNWLRTEQSVRADRIVIVGRSLGGAVATSLAHHLETTASIRVPLILQCTFTSIRDMLTHGRRSILSLWSWLLTESYPTAKRLRAMSSPVLVMHAVSDKVVPFAHGETLGSIVTARNPCSRFMPLNVGGHNDVYVEDRSNYMSAMKRFLVCVGLAPISKTEAIDRIGKHAVSDTQDSMCHRSDAH